MIDETKNPQDKDRLALLRLRAEKAIQSIALSHGHEGEVDPGHLTTELNIYHVELEMQNEELRQSQQDLEVSRQQLANLFAFAPVGILVLDIDGKIRDLNEMAKESFRIAPELLTKRTLQSFVCVEYFPEYAKAMKSLMEDGRAVVTEILMQVIAGYHFWARLDFRLVDDYGQKEKIVLCSLLNIDREKMAEQVLRRSSAELERQVEARTAALRESEQILLKSKQEAEQANAAKSAFLARMSHEIRTPMNAIIGMTDLVLQSELTEQQRQFLQTVRISSLSLLEIINGILDFSKIEAGKLGLTCAPFALRPTLTSICNEIVVLAEKKALALQVSVDAQAEDNVVGDSGVIRQVLVNLLANAIKFTDEGWVRLEVIKVAGKDDQESASNTRLLFVVSDSGPGIPYEKQAMIFEAFGQEHTDHSRQFGGTGLGLTISAQLVKLMGGEIALASSVGQGSRFSFELLLPKASGGMAVRGAAQGGTDQTRTLAVLDRPLSILLVDDNGINRMVGAHILKGHGCLVEEAEDGEQAVAAVKRGSFDVVLMDVQMPVMDGISATRSIRALEKQRGGHLPIIALTAHAIKGERERLLATGMDDYVSKPIMAEELFAAIRRQVSTTRGEV